MGFWKVLGGAAAGIGVIAALPILGPIGAVTAVGAVVGAGVGALAGGVASSLDDDEVTSAKRQGKEQGLKAAEAISKEKEEKLKSAFSAALNRLSDLEAKERMILGLFAVGYSVSNCDGELSPDEEASMRDFILGAKASEIVSQDFKSKIEIIRTTPPSFKEAFEALGHLSADEIELVDCIIEIIIEQDGKEHPHEKAFRQMWHERKALLLAS